MLACASVCYIVTPGCRRAVEAVQIETQARPQPIVRHYDLVEKVQSYNPKADEALLNRAYVFAMQAHGQQKRASGDPYISHPIEVASIHEIDYAHLLGGPVSRVVCFARRASSLEIETEDVAEILLEFQSGALGSVHVDYVQRSLERTCRVIGEDHCVTCAWRIDS